VLGGELRAVGDRRLVDRCAQEFGEFRGLGIKPNPVFLKPGDVMTLGIKGLGEQKQKVVAYSG